MRHKFINCGRSRRRSDCDDSEIDGGLFINFNNKYCVLCFSDV